MDFLGWYSTGDRPTLADIDIHRQITDINESPLFLQLSPGLFLVFFKSAAL
jgi:COP9 signalosome complex subunit 6